jgi:hypothetical protein
MESGRRSRRRSGGSYDFRLPPSRTAPVSRISGCFFAEFVLGDRLVQIRLPAATELELKPCQRHPKYMLGVDQFI